MAGQEVGQAVKYQQKWAFDFEIEGVVEGHWTKAGPFEHEFDIVMQEEGGRNTTASKRVGKFKTSNVTLERGLSTSPEIRNWADNQKKGIEDLRNCCLVAKAPDGTEQIRYPMEKCGIVKLTDGDYDGTAGGENALEKLELFLHDYDKVPSV